MKFKLPYYISNGGDGSASLNLYPRLVEAEVAEQDEDEPFGDRTADTIDLMVEDGKLFYRDWVDGSFQWVAVAE